MDALDDPKRAPKAGLPTLEDAIEGGSWLCGPTEVIIDKLMQVQAKWPGLEMVNMGLPVGTPQSLRLEQLERFGKEVIPAFNKKAATPVASD